MRYAGIELRMSETDEKEFIKRNKEINEKAFNGTLSVEDKEEWWRYLRYIGKKYI